MDTILFKYISERIKADQLTADFNTERYQSPKPIITISRTYGCNAEEVCQALTTHFNQEIEMKNTGEEPWIYVNKTVLNKVAEKMGVDPYFLNNANTPEQRDVVSHMIKTFSKDYNTFDSKLRKAIKHTTDTYLNRGNVILVGRGGIAFTKHNPNTLNIRLSAPFDWRVQRVSVNKDISYKEASLIVKEMDQKRSHLMQFLDADFNSEYYDIGFNRKTMPTQLIVESIIHAFKNKVEDSADKFKELMS